jgi:hypothetical protein
MKRLTANGRNSVARFPHALNRCIDNCTSAEDSFCLNYVLVKGPVELALGNDLDWIMAFWEREI